MTIDKNTWSKLSKKYPTKASWVRALNDLSWGEHDELFSALIDLDIADLATAHGLNTSQIGSVHIEAIDTDMIDTKYDKIQDSLEKSEQALAAANDALSRADDLSNQVVREINLNFPGPRADDEEIISVANRALDRLD